MTPDKLTSLERMAGTHGIPRPTRGYLAYPVDVTYDFPEGEPSRDDPEHELWESLMEMRRQGIEQMRAAGETPPDL